MTKSFEFIEHRISLQDDLIQILTEPVEFSYLNMDISKHIEYPIGANGHKGATAILIGLSNTVQVEKRQVNSYPEFFGELGGLFEFLSTVASVLIVLTQGGTVYLHMIRSLFQTRVDGTDIGP